MNNSRFIIGFITDGLSGIGSDFLVWHAIWPALARTAEARNANLITLLGGSINIHPNNKYEKTRNKIYEFVNQNLFDGIVFAGSSIGNYISKEELKNFCERYKPIPMVCIGGPIEGIPSVLMDNQVALKSMITHLYEEHKCKKIAFIRGPEGNNDADIRFNVYSEMLNNFGIDFDKDLVFTGNYLEASGAAAIRFWLDEKKADFKAIVASNDSMAIGAMKELGKRGISIPGTIAVTGFDDIEDAAVFNPPITTVKQPIVEMSVKAGEMLLDFLEGKATLPGNIYIQATPVVRQSCGCKPLLIQEFASISFIKAKADYKNALNSERMKILAKLTKILSEGKDFSKSDLVQKILDAYLSEIIENKDGKFIETVESILDEIYNSGDEVTIWHYVLSALRNSILPLIGNEDDFARADSMLQKAQLYINELSLRVISARKLNAEKRTLKLSIFAQALSTTFEMQELEETVIREIPRLNIPGFVISLYSDGNNKTENCRIFTLFRDGARVQPNENEAVYPSSILIPKSLLPSARRFSMIAAPLYFRFEHQGFILMETGPMDGIIYETAITQISSSLEGGLLINISRDAELALEKRARNIENVVMPMIETIKQVSGISAEKMVFVRDITGKTQESYLKIKDTNNIIEKVALNISNILQIINIINEISSTVNLVALNASIEATHAGEFGNGFAIIAREIKKLSDSTKKNSEEIARTLKDVVKNVQDTVSTGKDSLASFEEQKNGVETLIESLEVIMKNMDSLSDSSKKILEVMGQ